jgi:Predicted membrane protein (DUF2231)
MTRIRRSVPGQRRGLFESRKSRAESPRVTNAALIGSYVLSLRRRKDDKADGPALALSGLAAALIGLSGYFGGKLVYEHGVRMGRPRWPIGGILEEDT